MAVGIFAGIPVEDYSVALEWYKRLFGSEPAFYPNDTIVVAGSAGRKTLRDILGVVPLVNLIPLIP